jgi:ABC-type sugar transport system permease subunit
MQERTIYSRKRVPILVTWKAQRSITPYLMVAPATLILCTFVFYPLFSAIPMSLSKWDIIGTPKYVGFENYLRTIRSNAFLEAFKPTLIFCLSVVVVGTTLALGIAILLQQKLFLANTFRVAIFFPTLVPNVVVGMLWRYLFSTDFGLVNYLLATLGLRGLPWLSDVRLAIVAVSVAAIWRAIGWNVVIFFAGLRNIPGEYLEASKIDGATSWQSFRYITLPLLRPITLFVLVTTLINAFKSFDMIFVMTGGGPGTSTTTLMMHLYKVGFVENDLGRATVVGLILFAIVFLMTMIQLRIFRHEVTY